MSLDYRLTDIRDWKELLDEDQRPLPITTAIIHSCLAVGMGRITQTNAAEFYARLRLFEGSLAKFLTRPDTYEGEPFITAEEVRRHCGLHTNIPFERRVPWMKRVFGHRLDELKRHYIDETIPMVD